MTTTSPDIEGLHAALDAEPANQAIRLALADSLDEAGDPLAAEAMRWMASKGRRPTNEYLPASHWFHNPWSKWSVVYAILPDPFMAGFFRMSCNIDFSMQWRTRRQAEEALITCWRQMHAEERQVAWAWKPKGAAS